MSRLKKKQCTPETSRTQFMTTEVMSGIWSNHLDYSSYVGKAQWMDSGYLLPIIAYKYEISKLSFLTIVVQIHNMSMEDVVLLPIFTVMMKPNAVLQHILCLD